MQRTVKLEYNLTVVCTPRVIVSDAPLYQDLGLGTGDVDLASWSVEWSPECSVRWSQMWSVRFRVRRLEFIGSERRELNTYVFSCFIYCTGDERSILYYDLEVMLHNWDRDYYKRIEPWDSYVRTHSTIENSLNFTHFWEFWEFLIKIWLFAF